MITARKKIQMAFTAFLNQECCTRSGLLLVFRLIVFFEETEVLIQAFGSIKNVKVVLCNDKIIEFMVSQVGNRRQVFGERLEILYGRLSALQIGNKSDGNFII